MLERALAPPPPAPEAAIPFGRARRRGEATAGRILDAAEELFSERGYHGATLRDVADRVGLRIPSLYNHFAGKEALYAAVLARGIGPVVALLSELAEAPEAERHDPRRVVDPVMRLLAQRPHLPRLVLHETLSGGERLTPMLRKWMAPTFARAQELVEERAGRGSPLGSSRGGPLGASRGSPLGASRGGPLGASRGGPLGASRGSPLGASRGSPLGASRGSPLGASDGRLAPEQASLLVLAMYHVVIGFFASAPLYRAVTGIDLLAEPMLTRQTELLRQMTEALLPASTPR